MAGPLPVPGPAPAPAPIPAPAPAAAPPAFGPALDVNKKLSLVKGRKLIKANYQHIPMGTDDYFKKYNFLLDALLSYGHAATFFEQFENLTVGELFGKTRAQFLEVINTGWGTLVKAVDKAEIVPVSKMADPVKESADAFVSSKQHKQAFRKFQVAFRADSRGPEEIFNQGCVAKFRLPQNILAGIPGGSDIDVRETMMAKGMYKNSVNQDFFNETGVCVSRTLKGATKFPNYRDVDKEMWLYAVYVISGFDTEAWQLQLATNGKPTALWRPGEKALDRLYSWQVLGGIKFTRTYFNADYQNANDVFFKFKLIPPWKWHSTGYTRNDRKEYIKGESAPFENAETEYLLGDDFKME